MLSPSCVELKVPDDTLLTAMCVLQPRPGSSQLHDKQRHALGIVEGHEGDQSLRVRFKLTDASQAGNESGRARCAPSLHG